MIVEDDGLFYIVKSVFNNEIIGPYETREEAERLIALNNNRTTILEIDE